MPTPPMSAEVPFHESKLGKTPIRDLGLKIEGTDLEPVIAEVRRELEAAGLRRLRPHFYLTTQWIVPDDTIAVGIPFYLARPDLTAVHAEQEGHLEGVGRAELLRYLRHELGHVVNYAYRLYEREDWVRLFGSMTQPYIDEYRPEPFSRRFVLNLPGWYAQKHPDEDWAETFAVWLTPGSDWRAQYAGWPEALRKLDYCDRVLHEVGDREPVITAIDLEEEVGNLGYSVAEYYRNEAFPDPGGYPAGLDGALQTIFQTEGEAGDGAAGRRPAAELIRKWERELMADVYRWTGHFPERTRALLRHLADRAGQLRQVYPAEREGRCLAALATLVTALAMNHVYRGAYMP